MERPAEIFSASIRCADREGSAEIFHIRHSGESGIQETNTRRLQERQIQLGTPGAIISWIAPLNSSSALENALICYILVTHCLLCPQKTFKTDRSDRNALQVNGHRILFERFVRLATRIQHDIDQESVSYSNVVAFKPLAPSPLPPGQATPSTRP